VKPETSRQVAALFAGEFARLKDLEFIRFDELDDDGHAELIELASAFAGVPIAIDPNLDGYSDEDDDGSARPRG